MFTSFCYLYKRKFLKSWYAIGLGNYPLQYIKKSSCVFFIYKINKNNSLKSLFNHIWAHHPSFLSNLFKIYVLFGIFIFTLLKIMFLFFVVWIIPVFLYSFHMKFFSSASDYSHHSPFNSVFVFSFMKEWPVFQVKAPHLLTWWALHFLYQSLSYFFPPLVFKQLLHIPKGFYWPPHARKLPSIFSVLLTCE